MSNFSRRRFLGGAVTALPFGLTGSLAPKNLTAANVAGQADMLIVGKILTMNSYTPVAEAMTTLGDRVQAIGSLEEVMPFVSASTERIDVRDHTVNSESESMTAPSSW